MLLILGCGYVGEHLALAMIRQGWKVAATCRSEIRAENLRRLGIEAHCTVHPEKLPFCLLEQTEAILDSIPPAKEDDGPAPEQVQWLPTLARRLRNLRWAGYLSSTSVYGDCQGAWVDEQHPCTPSHARGHARLLTEQAWLASGLPVEVFRLAGIYGPGRNLARRLMQGNYTVVRWQPPHYSNRIHVQDIVEALIAAINRPRPERIMNLSDDLPLPHDEYVLELAQAIKAPTPSVLSPSQAERMMSARQLDFFRDSKRICNQRLHQELLPHLRYPNFRYALKELSREAEGAFTGGSG